MKRRRIEDIEHTLLSYKPYILIVTERRLHSNVSDGEIILPNYVYYAKTGIQRSGDVIILNDSLEHIRILDISGVEALCVNINICSTWIVACTFYRPPSASTEVFPKLDDYTSMHSRINSELIIGRVFNMPYINWASLTSTSVSSKVLLDLMFCHNLSQMVCEPTKVTEHCTSILDKISLSRNMVDNLSQLIVHEGIWITKWFLF